MAQTLFVLCGQAFAGKSTLAKKISDAYAARIVGRDPIYFAIDELLALDHTPVEDDSFLWKSMWPLVLQATKNHLHIGHSVVIDDNCIYRSERDQLRNIAERQYIPVVLVYLATPTEVLQKRKADNKITQHRHDVPSEWLVEDAELFEQPTADEFPIIYTPEMSFQELQQHIDL